MASETPSKKKDYYTEKIEFDSENESVCCPTEANPYQDIYMTPSSSNYSTVTTSNSVYTVDSKYELIQQGQLDGHDIPIRYRVNYGRQDGREWGIGKCRPVAFQKCANIKTFIFMSSLFAVISGALIAGYVSSVITTIEKRFDFGSAHSGLIAASVEVGCLVSVIFVSYFGSTRHKPVWIGCGAALQAVGALFFSLPHIIAEKYTISGGLNRTRDSLCRHGDEGHIDLLSTQMCMEKRSGNWFYILIIVVAQVLVGSGGSPLFTLGTTYIDDHVSQEKAPAYIAFIYATGALGPVLGFALGALMLQYYVDIFSFDSETLNLTPDDPRWVGAWWGGFLICGCFLCMIAIPFFGFPKVLHKEKAKLQREKDKLEELMASEPLATTSGDNKEPIKIGKTVKVHQEFSNEMYESGSMPSFREIPHSIYRLLTNPVYIIASLGISCEIVIVCGFIVFLPKYLETQWTMTKSRANLLTGCVAIPGAVIGILMGGYILKRFQLGAKGAVQLTLGLNLCAMTGFGLFFFFGCGNHPFAGATLPYGNTSNQKLLHTNLTSYCNMDCRCMNTEYEPVCGSNGMTYFSPCHAGCLHQDASSILGVHTNYTGCTCIPSNKTHTDSHFIGTATQGPCLQACHTLSPFMIIIFAMTFVVAGTQMPLLMITMRSVQQEERAFALGLQFVILRLFAYIPAPIVFGNTIDSTCLLWKKQCGQYGSCLMYDLVKFRYRFVGISFGMKVLGAIFYTALWTLLKYRETVRSPSCSRQNSTLSGPSRRKIITPPLSIADEATFVREIIPSNSSRSENQGALQFESCI